MKNNVEKKHAEKTYPILSHTFNQMIVRPLGRIRPASWPNSGSCQLGKSYHG